MSAAAWSCGQALLVHMSMRRAGLSIARIRHGFRLGCFVTAVVGCSGGSGGPAACICSAGIKSDTPSPQRASGRRQRRRTLGAGWVALVLLRNHEPQGFFACRTPPPKRRSRGACLSFNNLQEFFFRGNRGLFRLRLGVTPPVSNTGGKLPQISNSGPFCFAFGVTTSGFCFR